MIATSRLPFLAALLGSGGLLLAAHTASDPCRTGLAFRPAPPRAASVPTGTYAARQCARAHALSQAAQACAHLGRQR